MRAGKLLRIYLQDHDALAVITARVIRRSLVSNQGSPLGDLLAQLHGHAAEDREALHEVMDLVGVRPNRAKTAFGSVGVLLGRFKLNGRIVRYSPLSRVFELESLAALMEMRIGRWEALQTLIDKDIDLAGIDFQALIERSREDLKSLGPHHSDATATAF